MASRSLAVCLTAVVALLAVVMPASAHHRDWHGDWEGDGTGWVAEDPPAGDDGEWPADEVDPLAPPAPVPPVLPTPPAPPAPPAPEVLEPILPPLVTSRTVRGRSARLRTDGRAAIPRSAPKVVKNVIAAANQIVGKPYKWGGGHARLLDKGYDCSGTVSYALIRAGLLSAPLVSGSLARYGQKNAGRHITVYANKGHVYMEVAGLRLDTSPVADPSGAKGPRWRVPIGRRAGFKARHPLGL